MMESRIYRKASGIRSRDSLAYCFPNCFSLKLLVDPVDNGMSRRGDFLPQNRVRIFERASTGQEASVGNDHKASLLLMYECCLDLSIGLVVNLPLGLNRVILLVYRCLATHIQGTGQDEFKSLAQARDVISPPEVSNLSEKFLAQRKSAPNSQRSSGNTV